MRPNRIVLSIVDYLSGITPAFACTAALVGALKSGKGCGVDVTLSDVAMHELTCPATSYLNAGNSIERRPRFGPPAVVPREVFPTADGQIFLLCVLPKFSQALRDGVGLPHLPADPRFATPLARFDNCAALALLLNAALIQHSTAHWIALLAGKVPAAPVLTLAQAFDNPCFAESGGIQTFGLPAFPGLRTLSNPIRIDGARAMARTAPPDLGRNRSPSGRGGIQPGRYGCPDRQIRDRTPVMKMDGYRILDLSQFLPGPMVAQMLVDHGAEVIKIEPPSGEPVRNIGYRQNVQSVWFRNTHRGKKSVVLNLKNPTDVATFLILAETADVVPEAFRPGVQDRLGVGYDAVRAVNPRIVYASISAFGQAMPEALRPGHDLAIKAMSGVISLILSTDSSLKSPHMPVADLAGSLTALPSIPMALLRRENTGLRDHIDISMPDATMAWLPNVRGPVFAEERASDVRNKRSFGGYAFFYIYKTADAHHVALGGDEHKFVVNVLNAGDRPDLMAAACGPNGRGQQPVKAALAQIFRTKT